MSEIRATPATVVVIGDALIDELRDAHGSREFVGGAALNVAVGVALLGERASLVAMLGDDEPAERIRAYLRDFRVALVESPSAHGTSRAVSDRTDGEPRYEFNEAAKRRGIRFDDATRAAIDAADLVVVSCFPFDDDEQFAALVAAVDRPSERLIVDGNPRAGMLHDRDRFLANFERFAASSMLAKVGDEDAELLLGAPLAEFVARILGGGGRPGTPLHGRSPPARSARHRRPGGRDGARDRRRCGARRHRRASGSHRRHDGCRRRHSRRSGPLHRGARAARDAVDVARCARRCDDHRGCDRSTRGSPPSASAHGVGGRPKLSRDLTTADPWPDRALRSLPEHPGTSMPMRPH